MSKFSKLTDEKLVELVRNRETEQYAEVMNRYKDKLMRYARYLTNDEDLAADAVQSTFIKAYINLYGFDTKKKFSSWIYRIAHNEAVNLIKKNSREVSLDPEYDVPGNQNIEEEFDKKEIVKQARSCLGQMPIMYSEPLALHYLDGKSYEEVSDILRMPMGTVATRISRAKILMKKICQK
jgi:RNA polymerase sigma-70 factor (ECF subfamily)